MSPSRGRRDLDRPHVRWVYLRDAWPEAEATAAKLGSLTKAMWAAPPEAVEAALVRELDVLSDVLEKHRARARAAEDALAALQQACRRLLGTAAPAHVADVAQRSAAPWDPWHRPGEPAPGGPGDASDAT